MCLGLRTISHLPLFYPCFLPIPFLSIGLPSQYPHSWNLQLWKSSFFFIHVNSIFGLDLYKSGVRKRKSVLTGKDESSICHFGSYLHQQVQLGVCKEIAPCLPNGFWGREWRTRQTPAGWRKMSPPLSSGTWGGEGTGVSKGMLQKVREASTPAHIKCLGSP